MVTLVNYFIQGQPELQAKLRSATTIAQIAEIIENEIVRLADINGEYVGGLTKPQSRIALSMLESFRLSFSMLTVTCEAPKPAPLSVSYEHEREPYPNPINGILGGLVGGAFGGTMTGMVFGGAMGAMLGAVVAMLSSMTLRHTKAPGGIAKIDIQDDANPVAIDFDHLLRYVKQILDAIDQTVAEYSRLSEPVKHTPKLEDHADILDFAQNLIGEASVAWAQLPSIIKARVDNLPSILRKYGIHVKTYQPDSSEDQDAFFNYESSLDDDLQVPVMSRPALVKDNEPLIRGTVIIPNKSDL